MPWLYGSSMCANVWAWGGSSFQFQLGPWVWHQKNTFPPLFRILTDKGWEYTVTPCLKWCHTVLSFHTILPCKKKRVSRLSQPWNGSSMCEKIARKCWYGGCQPVCTEPWLAALLWKFPRPWKFCCPSCAAVVDTLTLIEKHIHHRMPLVAVSDDETWLGTL